MISIQGVVHHVTYYNEDNGYTIAKFKQSDFTGTITIVGVMGEIHPGEKFDITGKWEEHEKFGEQFRVEFFESILPDNADEIRTYLSSGIIKGLGPSTAKKIVEYFGEETITIIESSPESIASVPGIGEKTAKAIASSWASHHFARQLMQYFYDSQIPSEYASVVIRKYGSTSMDLVTRDPYKLVLDNPDLNFEYVDKLGKKAGIEPDDEKRIKAYVVYLLEKATKNGHCFLQEEELKQKLKNLIPEKEDNFGEAIKTLDENDYIQRDETESGNVVYPYYLYKSEKGVADKINAIFEIPAEKIEIDDEDIKQIVAEHLGLIPSPEQLEAIQGIINNKAGIITGGPGTGKTTLVRALCRIFKHFGMEISLAAPTGRAARRLSEVTHTKAETIHRLLKYNQKTGYFDKDESDPLEADVLIVDETSMLDIVVCYHLLKAVTLFTRIIFVGDICQLPSVGPGNFLADLIEAEKIPSYRLKSIFRQAKQSPIIMNAHRINNGEMPLKEEASEKLSEFYFIQKDDPEKTVDSIIELCKNRIPKRFNFDPMEEIQVITPMHKGATGTINLNKILQKELNNSSSEVKIGNMRFKKGDKVMHLVNNYQKEVFNGDIGRIKNIDLKNEILNVEYPDYPDKKIVEYSFDELDELTLAYAISVHKSQGSEYPAVIIPLMTQHYPLLQRNLLYTGMTRGKSLLILIGSTRAVNIAVTKNQSQKRYSALKKRLCS